jgi:hypothetical protein
MVKSRIDSIQENPKSCLPVSYEKKDGDKKLQNCNFASCSAWERNVVSHLREEHILRVSENTVLRIFGPKKEEYGSYRKLHNDELHGLYSSPNIVRVIKSRRMRWAGHVARMEEEEVFMGVWLGSPKVRDYWEDLSVGGRIPLRWTLVRRDRWGELDSAGSGQGPVADFCEHGNEPSGSIKKAG